MNRSSWLKGLAVAGLIAANLFVALPAWGADGDWTAHCEYGEGIDNTCAEYCGNRLGGCGGSNCYNVCG